MATPTRYLYQYIDNTVADTISMLDYNLTLTRHTDDEDGSKEKQWNNFFMLNRAL